MIKMIPVFAIACVMLSCNDNAEKQAQIDAQQRTMDSMKMEMVKKQTIDSMNAVAAQQQAVVAPVVEQRTVSTVHHTVRHPSGTATTNSYTTNNTTNYGNAPAATAPAPEKKKKGWSAKATGTLVGAGVGAITGAMVDKKKGEGAVVGGLIGAAGGLGAGAIIDKKKKDKEKENADK